MSKMKTKMYPELDPELEKLLQQAKETSVNSYALGLCVGVGRSWLYDAKEYDLEANPIHKDRITYLNQLLMAESRCEKLKQIPAKRWTRGTPPDLCAAILATHKKLVAEATDGFPFVSNHEDVGDALPVPKPKSRSRTKRAETVKVTSGKSTRSGRTNKKLLRKVTIDLETGLDAFAWVRLQESYENASLEQREKLLTGMTELVEVFRNSIQKFKRCDKKLANQIKE